MRSASVRDETIRAAGHDTYLINHLGIPGGMPKEEGLAYTAGR
jgi:hypothetical protein